MSWQAEKAHGEEIAYQLAPLGTVAVARFFSGAALRLDGVMFGFMSRGSLFLRVDDVNRPAFVAAGMGPFSYARPTRTVALEGYYETPADVLEDAGALFDWCRSAYRAALLAGPTKRKARVASKTVSGAGPKAAPKAAPKATPKAAAKLASKPEPKKVSRPAAKSASKLESAQKAKPASKSSRAPAPKPATKRKQT
ncbi:competence protein TfoX [Burkholderia sp. HI2761]|uniref:TfoX/Sxy family protein n=1 Tax=unclassified Burkholderia TaxID=2613784 RepID=UPI000B79C44D|nr:MULTISPECIES: TfoX/Sxy family protein [unclassified Burkholderia]MPV56753.1 competence protein TfoX [Burkholderia sp. BE24]OXJ25101.1 competence protein TfoX [Burkholderia sp. HI2761]